MKDNMGLSIIRKGGMMSDIYQTATRKFLDEFDVYWKQTLQLLDCEQSQLVEGNRLRPQISLWGYLSTLKPGDVAACDYSQIANVAISIELIHKASLLIDDWVDGDIERHGQPAFHAEHSPEYTVLFALNMIGLAMRRLKNVFSDSIVLPHHYELCLNTLVQTIYAMSQGALKELKLQENDYFNSKKIKEISQLETADIIGNSLLLGYYTGIGDNCASEVESIFKQIGDQCGFLFQALNDLEAFGNPEKLRAHKGAINTDYASNRKNMTIVSLYALANRSDRILLQHADEKELMQLMKKYKIVETLTRELEAVYANILLTANALQDYGLASEWCLGFQAFLGYVKKFAERRLKA